MSKKTSAAKTANYDNVTPALLNLVNTVLADADKHKYSVSRVYRAHNTAFGKNDTPQTCSSCLRNRVRELKAWKKGYDETQPSTTPKGGSKGGNTPEGVDLETAFGEYLAARGITEESPHEDKRNALLAFREAFDAQLTDEQRAHIEEGLAYVTPEQRYDALVKRLGLAVDPNDPQGEIATLHTMLEPGYPNELTDDETDAVLTRLNALEAANVDPNAPEYAPPAEGVIRYPMGDDVIPFDFTPNADDDSKGLVKYADGSKVKAGTYVSANGVTFAVQPGGKASIKANEDLL